MNHEGKCIEYYFDSKTFTKDQLIKSIEEAKLEFPNKKVETDLFLNQWGVYILKINFKDKIEYISNLKEKEKIGKYYFLQKKIEKLVKKELLYLTENMVNTKKQENIDQYKKGKDKL